MTTSMTRLTRHPRVEIVDDERAIGNGIMVTLKAGWTFDQLDDNRVRGFDTITAALSDVNHAFKTTAPLTS